MIAGKIKVSSDGKIYIEDGCFILCEQMLGKDRGKLELYNYNYFRDKTWYVLSDYMEGKYTILGSKVRFVRNSEQILKEFL